MTSNLDNPRRSTGDRARARAYLRDFLIAMAAYAVVLTAVVTWGQLDGSSPLRFVWALLPVVPALWIVRAVLRHVNRVDDYQRLLLLQGLAVGFAIAMVAAVTVGFLAAAGLVLPDAGWVIYAAGMLGWLGASLVAGKRC
jgi:hypothetical protein